MIYLLNNPTEKMESLQLSKQFNFMTFKMTSFDKYYESLKSPKDLKERSDDILFHLNQLMYIYINSSVLLRWVETPTEEIKVSLYKTFFEQESIKEIASYYNHFSSSRYEALGEKVQKILSIDFEEYSKEISESFSNIKLPLKEIKDTWHKFLYIKYNLCFYIFTCLWQFFRVFPDFTEYHIVGTLDLENGEKINIPDFIDYTLYESNMLGQEKSNPLTLKEVLRTAASESLLNYIKLAQLFYNSTDEKMAQIVQNYFIQNNLTNLFNNSFNHFEFATESSKDEKYENPESSNKEQFEYIFATKVRKVMFEELIQNEYFKNINAIVPSFYDYCYLLIDCNYLEYKDNLLQTVYFQNGKKIEKKFPDYYFYRFLHDESFDLYFQKKTIKNDYAKLINVPVENNRSCYGYEDEFQTFFLNKYNELQENKKAYAKRM